MDPQMQRFVQQQQQAAQVQVLQNRKLLLNYGWKCCVDGSSFIASFIIDLILWIMRLLVVVVLVGGAIKLNVSSRESLSKMSFR